MDLDRPLLRRLRAQLKDAQALIAAGRVLRRRDVSRRMLDERLARAGISSSSRRHAVAALADAGAVDDRRFAERRAASLAERGWDNAGIRAKLQSEGVGEEEIAAALAQLPAEAERAARIVAQTNSPRRAWSLLSRRGFDTEILMELAATLDEGDSGGLG